MGGKTSQFKKRSKKRRKDEDIIFDNVVMVEEESSYIIKDEKGNIVHPNNKMAFEKDAGMDWFVLRTGSRLFRTVWKAACVDL